MRIRTTLTTLSTIVALAMMAVSAYSQNFSGAQNMGTVLNSSVNDNDATLAPNGLSLYFSSPRSGQGDIYVSQRKTLNSAWDAPQNLGATVNTSDSTERVTSISLDGLTMFLFSTRQGGMGGNDLYLSTRTDPNDDFGWSTPVNLGAVINTQYQEFSASYFENPTTGVGTLIFSSNRTDGNLNYDLFQSTRNSDGTFNAPVPIDELNSIGAELRTAIRRDGLEIFIGASRPGGMAFGLFDIWVSTRDSTSSPWKPPSLVAGINTMQDDNVPSLSPDGSILYFTSNRAGGSGGLDLYSVTRCSLYSTLPCSTNRSTADADFDGDGRTDISVFRPSEGNWYILQSANNTVRIQSFGLMGDKIVSGDYDGDGRTDFAVFRPSDGNWYVLRSSDSAVSIVTWGLSTDKPVPGDYDGDGRTDMAVFRDGVWYILQSSTGTPTYSTWGLASDIPVAGVNAQ